MRKENVLEIKEDVKIGNVILEKGDKLKVLKSYSERIDSERIDSRRVYDGARETLIPDIADWFEGPRGFENTEEALREVISIYKEALDEIDIFEIFED